MCNVYGLTVPMSVLLQYVFVCKSTTLLLCNKYSVSYEISEIIARTLLPPTTMKTCYNKKNTCKILKQKNIDNKYKQIKHLKLTKLNKFKQNKKIQHKKM